MMNEQKLRSIIRQTVAETRTVERRQILSEESSELYKAFVEPFVDVVQSANLFTKDILNIFGLAFATLFTFSPEKLAKAREKYEGRRDKIAQEWKPIMDRAGKSLENTDIGLLTMAFAPNIFFANQVGQLGAAGYDTVAGYLGAMGVIDYVSKQGGNVYDNLQSWLKQQEREAKGRQREEDRSGITGRLRAFFLGEGAIRSSGVLAEAEGGTSDTKKEKPSKSVVNQQLNDLFSDKGPLGDLFKETKQELLDAKEEEARDLVSIANTIIGGLRGMSQAQNIEDFETAVSNLKGQLKQKDNEKIADFGPIEKAIQNLKTEMESKYSDIAGKKGSDKKSPAPEGSKPKDIELVAKKASEDAFTQGAGELRRMASDAADKATENYKKGILTELMSDLKGPLEKSPAGKELIEKLKKIVDSIGR